MKWRHMMLISENIWIADESPSELRDDSPLEWPISHLDRHKSVTREDLNQRPKSNSALSSREFIIPELPSGSKLTIDILSTWGDRHYVGLNGIEMFTKDGIPPQIVQVSMCTNNQEIKYEISFWITFFPSLQRFGLSRQISTFYLSTMETHV